MEPQVKLGLPSATNLINIAEIAALRLAEKILKETQLAKASAEKVTRTKGNNTNKTWTIKNVDDKLTLPITGAYGASEYTEDLQSNYMEFTTLGRSAPIVQFLNTNANTISFTGVIFAKDAIQQNKTVKLAIENLKKWSRYDKSIGRPPLISLSIAKGIGSVNYAKALITACNIKYIEYDNNGNIIHAEINLSIKEYTPYAPKTQNFDTRYHNVLDGDYHELLAAREYNNPMLGVVLRTYNNQSELSTGDVVALPDKQSQSVSTSRIKPKSLIFGDYLDKRAYTSYLANKTDGQIDHIIDIVNNKIQLRAEQYSQTI